MATKLKLTSRKRVAVATSMLLAVCWVSNYHYRYNIAAFNTHGINIWAFALWSITGYITLQILSATKRNIAATFLHLPLTWVLYFGILLCGEYIGYHILQIREQSAGPDDALILGLVHGSKILHIYYLIFPIIISTAYNIVANIIGILQQQGPYVKNLFLQRRIETKL